MDLAVWARATARAARALSTSARARSTWAPWLSTVASAASCSALTWATVASKVAGSIRAMSCPRLTSELKSANSSLTCPETCEPTWTVMTALRFPVVVTKAVMLPRVTGVVRKRGAFPVLWE